jgi:hypothetical protein
VDSGPSSYFSIASRAVPEKPGGRGRTFPKLKFWESPGNMKKVKKGLQFQNIYDMLTVGIIF